VTTITAIQTNYAGCHFRSRLEARWAVFLDNLGVPWQYEPEGFDLGHTWYLPDFYLPTLGAWYEVKGSKPTEAELGYMFKLAEGTQRDAFIVWGDIPRDVGRYGHPNFHDTAGMEGFFYSEGADDAPDWAGAYWDNLLGWCVCPVCRVVGIRFEARAARLHEPDSDCPHACEWGRGHNGDDPALLAAYQAARSARFEHGQSGSSHDQRTTP
jgi:hypothetical protein